MRYGFTMCLIGMTMLSACGRDAPKKAEKAALVEKGMPLEKDAHGGRSEVVRMHRVAGRWESQPGVMASAKNEWISLNISNDSRFSLETHSEGPDKVLQVGAIVSGAIAWTTDGVMTGSGPGAKGPLKDFGQWRGSFPEQGRMRITGSGKSYDLTYRGL